jgi:N-methylhydantoinase A
MRVAVDTGGTFTDLVAEDEVGNLHLFKSPTTPEDPVRGILTCIDLAATTFERDRAGFLGQCEMFMHATTRAINAILTGTTARTAFVTTRGHRDILLFREGGRRQPFDHRREYPDPYVPRRLTFEVDERVASDGQVLLPLTPGEVHRVIAELAGSGVEAVGVCLLWSIINPEHELLIGDLLRQKLPDVAVTLSHQLNPSIREYRRASSTCIDASLKPVMSEYLANLRAQLQRFGFSGRLLMVSSSGGVLDAAAARGAPIHTLKSGPAMAPVAGRFYASLGRAAPGSVIVTDAGGTSFDVSLVRRDSIPWTRETWLGEEYTGDITGFPSVDVKSIGAGGGSIAWVDDGGLLRVGPQSAGSEPGPACYGKGGSEPTVTDACVELGFLDPAFFLGGSISLDPAAATAALQSGVGSKLKLDPPGAAAAVLTVATEQMVHAIEETTVYRGVDPTDAILIGGGGAAGFNIVAIAQRLGCSSVLIPSIGPGLSAAGALLSDLLSEYAITLPTATTAFAFDRVNRVLEELRQRCSAFSSTADAKSSRIDLFAEARYPDQVWELEVPLRMASFSSEADVEQLRADFHATHHQVFGVSDPGSQVEVLIWRARVSCDLGRREPPTVTPGRSARSARSREAFFPGSGWAPSPVFEFDQLEPGVMINGPALVESPQTTVVIYPEASARRTLHGSLVVDPSGQQPASTSAATQAGAAP